MCAMYGKTYGFDVTDRKTVCVRQAPAAARRQLRRRQLYPRCARRRAAANRRRRHALPVLPVRSGPGNLAVDHPASRQAGYPYNVGSARSVTIAELARTVIDATRSDAAIEIAQRAVPGAMPRRYVPNVDRAASELGLRDHVRLEDRHLEDVRMAPGAGSKEDYRMTLQPAGIDDGGPAKPRPTSYVRSSDRQPR